MQLLVLVAITALSLLPGLATLPPIDRDEPHYLEATRQMVTSGDHIDIRFQDQPRYQKPVGIYWLQSLAVAATGEGAKASIAAYRAVSVAGLLISVLGVFWIGSMLFGRNAGFVAALMIAGIAGTGFEGRIGKTDAMLLAVTVIAQGALARIHADVRSGRDGRTWPALVFWLAQGVGVLIKGPISLLASGFTVIGLSVLERDWCWLKRLRPVAGGLLLALVVFPWPLLLYQRTGWVFLHTAVGDDLLGKVADGQQSHGAPPGYYVLTFSLMVWPFGAMAVGAGLAAIDRWRLSPALRFCLCWYLPFWLVFEVIATKLPHYVLPAYPALALLLGWAATGADVPRFGDLAAWQRWLWRFAAFGVAAVTLVLAGLVIGAPFYFHVAFPPVAVFIAALILTAGGLGLATGLEVRWKRIVGMAIAAATAYGLFFGLFAPALTPLWPSRSIARIVAAAKPCPTTTMALAGYHEPSIVFLLGERTRLTDLAGVADHLQHDPACALAVVPAAQFATVKATLAKQGLPLRRLDEVEGLDLGGGGWVDLDVVTSASDTRR
ncbi:glycosyltransferase family 39 protein [Jiella sp. CQZ9-1]|uniref:Glycosyltransferase family 39 protein n=2 Tax=Jiella flava TaxID=2816857 RepID=A0A939JVU7_9HYPH|nr:glycosyltransferase family 39 protein [Jiella flava]MBO0662839.1 glycosyltransferase family 39 protein [Jiella flava]